MKKSNMLSVLVTIVMFFTLSCTTGQVQFDQESQVTIAKITGRRAGYQLEVRYPEISHEVLVLSKVILSVEKPDLIRITIDRIVVILAAEIDDPLLAADLQDIISLIKIETGIEIEVAHMQIIQATVLGLVSGIEIAQTNKIKGE